MRPTLFGIRAALFYGAIVVAYFAAPYVNLFFLLLAFLTAVNIAGVVWGMRALSGVQANPTGSITCTAESDAPGMAAEIVARRRTRFDVGVRLELGGKPGEPLPKRRDRMHQGTVPVLRRGQPTEVEISFGRLARGVYPVRGAELTSTYPFGLLRRRRVLEGISEVVVHPRPSAFGAGGKGKSGEDWMRELQASGSGDDLQPATLRDKRDGDPLRAVHWRASARRGKPVVVEWEGGTGGGLEIALDRRCGRVEFEGALSDVAALVQVAREAKDVLMIRTQDHARSFGEGHGSWDDALRLLAELEPLPPGAPGLVGVAPSVPVLPQRRPREEAALV